MLDRNKIQNKGWYSVLFPGLGQLFKNRGPASIFFLFVVIASYLISIPFGIFAHVFCVWDALIVKDKSK